MAGERRRRKRPKENRGAKVMLVIFSVMFVLSLGIYVNEKVLRLEFIPTSAEIMAAFSGKKPVAAGDGEVAVHFIDVGQGDCAFVAAGDTRVLIDCGMGEYSSRVISYISSLGIRRIDYVIATHPHDDHIGGMADILEEFAVGKIIMPQVPDYMIPMGDYIEDMLSVIERKGIQAEYSRTGTIIPLENGAEIQLVGPVHNDYSSLNNFSIACRLSYGMRSFLFTGDIERAAESDIINSGEYIRSDVLKIPHHGSASSSTPSFLGEVSPEYAVISVGEDNPYGHPRPEIVERLVDLGCTILTTMEYGNIVFVTDGESLKIHTDNSFNESAQEAA